MTTLRKKQRPLQKQMSVACVEVDVNFQLIVDDRGTI